MAFLAKSGNPETGEVGRTLKQHIEDCLLIWNYLIECFPAVETFNTGYWDLLRFCIIFHDLGKAHEEFQKLLNGKPNVWNSQRHELFSLPFVGGITTLSEDESKLISLVIAGHHKDMESLRQYLLYYGSRASFGISSLDEERDSFIQAFEKHVDIEAVQQLVQEYSISIGSIFLKPVDGLIHSYVRNPYRLEKPSSLKLTLLFGGFKWCDHLGSALVSNLEKLEASDFSFLADQQARLQSKGLDFYDHQKESARQLSNLILTAPTGSGKTESAFLWLQNQLEKNGQGRVFYVLPFTASINAMYERLKNAVGNGKVGMLHGKLGDYLNNFFEDLQYDLQSKKEEIKSIREKYKSLAVPVKVVTPFQLLKHIFGLKGYEQGIFEMTGSYIIFDEIHAYQPEVFAQIKVLVEFATQQLKAKTMIMTATMPKFLKNELELSIGDFNSIEAHPELYEQFKRHHVTLKEGTLLNSIDSIAEQYRNGKKVLVVCNTVKQAQKAYGALVGNDDEKTLLLHGSFTGKDRSRIERRLLNQEINLLVGTQAIEVSLDIDYDIIFSEPAPIDALIQRFGRVNRSREKGISPCIVFQEANEDDKFIYNPEIVSRTVEALEQIEKDSNGIIDESILQKAIDSVYPDWDIESKKLFQDAYMYMDDALKQLAPMQKNRYSEEDFYKQFDGIKVLPQCKKQEFLDCLNRFDFISAEAYKVQIRKGRFAQWLESQNLRKQVEVFGQSNKVNEVNFYETNKKYNPILGLIADEEESWKNNTMIL